MLIRPGQVGCVSHPRRDARLADPRQQLSHAMARESVATSGGIALLLEHHRDRIGRMASSSEFHDSPAEILQAVQRALRPQALTEMAIDGVATAPQGEAPGRARPGQERAEVVSITRPASRTSCRARAGDASRAARPGT